MVQFKGSALDLNIGDIVIERQVGQETGDILDENHWVIYKIDNTITNLFSTIYEKSYYAFLLNNAELTIGPIIFRNADMWQYEVLTYG